jgi:hypothetical protein
VHPAEPVIDRARVRRQTVTLLVVVDLLVLGIGLVAAVDLRRLATPEGTALRWVQAAVFGDCEDYLRFSVADPAVPESRAEQEVCQDLRQATAEARRTSLTIGLAVASVARTDAGATVAVVLVRSGDETSLTVHLVRRDGQWRVLRDVGTCSSVGCA